MSNFTDIESPKQKDSGSRKRSLLTKEEFQRTARFRLALFEFQRKSEAVLDDFEIGSRQFFAMLVIKSAKKDDYVTVGMIAQEMGIHPSSASGLIARLETAGFAERIFDLENRRQVRVRLTQDGEEKLALVIASDAKSAEELHLQYRQLMTTGAS